MLDALRTAFREAVENFKTELNRDRVSEFSVNLLREMGSDLVELRQVVMGLEEELALALDEADKEADQASTCLRRAALADQVGDSETAEVARSFASRHGSRARALREKASALRLEIQDRVAELESGVRLVKAAKANVPASVAQAGRVSARASLRGADPLFEAFDRLESELEDEVQLGIAEMEVDARLAELKARVARNDDGV